MSVNDIRDFIFENYYKEIGFSKESSYSSMKHLKRKDLLLLANNLLANNLKAVSTTFLLVCFVCLKESNLKALFILETIKF